jgi:hypothetical protein
MLRKEWVAGRHVSSINDYKASDNSKHRIIFVLVGVLNDEDRNTMLCAARKRFEPLGRARVRGD